MNGYAERRCKRPKWTVDQGQFFCGSIAPELTLSLEDIETGPALELNFHSMVVVLAVAVRQQASTSLLVGDER